MSCPLLSPHPEKAARANWPPPTVRPGWAPTCEDDALHPSVHADCVNSSHRPEDYPIVHQHRPAPHHPTSCFSAGDRHLKDFKVLKRSLLPPSDDMRGKKFFFLVWPGESKRRKCVQVKAQHLKLYISGRRCTLLCLHSLTATRF